jgi:hypothetical protein
MNSNDLEFLKKNVDGIQQETDPAQDQGPMAAMVRGVAGGSNARVRIPDSATFDLGTGAFSIELWFNFSAAWLPFSRADASDRGCEPGGV